MLSLIALLYIEISGRLVLCMNKTVRTHLYKFLLYPGGQGTVYYTHNIQLKLECVKIPHSSVLVMLTHFTVL